MIQVVPATIEHVQAMHGRVRRADIEELWDGHGITPEKALNIGLQISYLSRAALHQGRVLCVFGIAPGQDGSVPWMVASDEVEGCKREFLQASRETIQRLCPLFSPLYNWVDARNRRAIAWLKWCGFKVEPPEPFGEHVLPFCKFTMEVPCAPPQ